MRSHMTLVRATVVALAAATQVVACYEYETPAPKHFTSATVDTVPFDSIRGYANGLKFNSRLYAADIRRVRFDSLRSTVDSLGDSARIEPELGAWALDSNELAQGRIIARIRTKSVHTATGYGPWWTWWWVDKHGGLWRSLLLSDSLKTRIPDSLKFHVDTGYLWRQSIARWGSQWSTCTAAACCTKE
jgi:hypothetical protein